MKTFFMSIIPDFKNIISYKHYSTRRKKIKNVNYTFVLFQRVFIDLLYERTKYSTVKYHVLGTFEPTDIYTS